MILIYTVVGAKFCNKPTHGGLGAIDSGLRLGSRDTEAIHNANHNDGLTVLGPSVSGFSYIPLGWLREPVGILFVAQLIQMARKHGLTRMG